MFTYIMTSQLIRTYFHWPLKFVTTDSFDILLPERQCTLKTFSQSENYCRINKIFCWRNTSSSKTFRFFLKVYFLFFSLRWTSNQDFLLSRRLRSWWSWLKEGYNGSASTAIYKLTKKLTLFDFNFSVQW